MTNANDDAARKTAEELKEAQRRAKAEAEAARLTEESVLAKFKAVGDKPSPTAVQSILDIIAYVADDTKRILLFTVAKQAVKGPLKAMIDKAQSKANRDWKERRKYESEQGEQAAEHKKREPATSEIPLPWWGKGYYKYQNRTFVYGPRQDNGEFDHPLHSSLRLRSTVSFPDRTVQGRDHVRGIMVEFEDDKGQIRKFAFQRSQALTPPTNKEGMIPDLANAGVSFTGVGIQRLQEVILSAGVMEDGGAVYDYPGWREPDIFITPGGEVIGSTNRDVGLFKPLRGVKRAGTSEKWREAIAPAFSMEVVEKAPQLPATLLFSFVSPLADRAEEEMSLILSLAGKTTRLKTYSLRLKASVWGMTLPKDDPAVLVTFNATPNKMEEYAVERSGCGMALDDSTLIEAMKLGPFLYRLTTCAEKGRKNEEGRRWMIACVITSEVPIQQFLRAGGYEPPPGVMSRVVEIPVLDNRVSDGPINKLAGAFDNYGHAGPEFVTAMLAGGWTRDKIREAIKDKLVELLGGAGMHEQSRRVARGVAFIWLAGDIAQTAGLIPADFDVKAFATGLWEKVKGGADTSDSEVFKVKNKLALGIRDGSIPIYSDKGIALATGAGSGAICVQNFGKSNDPVFVLTGPALAEIVGSRVTVKDVAKALDDAGILYRQQNDRLTWKSGCTGVGDTASYVLYARAILGEDAIDMIQEHWSARRGSGAKLGVVPVVGLNREAS